MARKRIYELQIGNPEKSLHQLCKDYKHII